MTRRVWVPIALVLVAAGTFLAARPGSTVVENARFLRQAARFSSAVPDYLTTPPLGMSRGVAVPWRVGIQAGHWNIQDLPDEQQRLRGDTGTRWGKLPEADVNLAIARAVADRLRAAGVTVDLLPATVPVDYEADAFVAIHADDGAGRPVSGWKVAAPRLSSPASRLLRDSIARSYGAITGLPEDRYGVTFQMRGYYAFSWTRFAHAASPITPAAIIETGYLTSASDRQVIVDDPGTAAAGIALGILAFLGERPYLVAGALVPVSYPTMAVGADNAILRSFPADDERIAAHLSAGTVVRPVDEENGWAELTVMGNYRVSGWMKISDLKPLEGWS